MNLIKYLYNSNNNQLVSYSVVLCKEGSEKCLNYECKNHLLVGFSHSLLFYK